MKRKLSSKILLAPVPVLGMCVFGVAAACSTGERPPPTGVGGPSVVTSGGAKGFDAPPTGSGGGSSKGGSSGSDAGADSGSSSGSCGNDVKEVGEECDGNDLANLGCTDLGYEQGTLSCSGCQFDTSGCSGTERCFDAKDNDGDGKVDCQDGDCQAACSSSCDAPPVLSDPAVVSGRVLGHASQVQPTCASKSSGSEVVYRVVAQHAGVVEAVLTTKEPLVLSLRQACDAQELVCSGAGRVEHSASAGEVFYVAVDAVGSDLKDGAYELSVASRNIVCGDGHTDTGEQCDDGQPPATGDGCDASCQIESIEKGTNDKVSQADPISAGFHPAQIEPAGDVDYFKVDVPDGASLIVDTFDFGDGACSKRQLDAALMVFGPDQQTMVAEDDDSGAGSCAHIALGNLPGGTYTIAVFASAFGDVETFGYVLAVVVDACGNGNQVETEGCDDANVTPGDGCSATCQRE